jgi:hypothetical protein
MADGVNKYHTLRTPATAAAALVSGAALVISILFRVPLGFALVVLGGAAGIAVACELSRINSHTRSWLRLRFTAGALAGVFSTAAYDGVRWLLVELGNLSYQPFEAFPFFGYAIVGRGAPASVALTVGTIYHYVNGILFAVFYCLLLGGRKWFFGVLWALALEALMFTLYPGWLDLKAVMREFTFVSITGHLAYGSTLGVLSQRRFRASPNASRS